MRTLASVLFVPPTGFVAAMLHGVGAGVLDDGEDERGDRPLPAARDAAIQARPDTER